MKHLLLLGSLLLSLVICPVEGMLCKKPDTGPPGPQGPRGAPGAPGAPGRIGPIGPRGPFIKRTAAAHTDELQTFIAMEGNAISFEHNNFVPMGIIHPTITGGFTEFTVLNSGYYFITFTFSVFSNGTTTNDISAHLVNATTGTPILPDPFAQTRVFDGFAETLSGQTIVFLSEDTTVRLEVSQSESGTITIESPIFTITQIAPP